MESSEIQRKRERERERVPEKEEEWCVCVCLVYSAEVFVRYVASQKVVVVVV